MEKFGRYYLIYIARSDASRASNASVENRNETGSSDIARKIFFEVNNERFVKATLAEREKESGGVGDLRRSTDKEKLSLRLILR